MADLTSSGPLLSPDSMAANTVDGAVDSRGLPAARQSTGRWSAASCILGVEIAERFAYHGVSANLISYLTGPLGESTAAAAAAVNAWSGVATMLPLPVAVAADVWLGRYRTIVVASFIFVLGMVMLSLSSVLPIFRPGHACGSAACPPSPLHVAIFYISLYLVALAEGGHKPCAQAFGADQFDQDDPKESASRSSFFNWWYFGMCTGTAFTLVISSYIQDNIGWGLGFGIPCIVMVFALIAFLAGTRWYRFYITDKDTPLIWAGKALLAASSGEGWRSRCSAKPVVTGGEADQDDAENPNQANEVRGGILCLLPIWAACIIYAVIFSQSSTFFTKQAATLDRRIGPSFQVPPASLQVFISLTIMTFIPLYDRIFVPVARQFSGLRFGITMLQRIGTGILLSLISMIVAALVEMKRLEIAREAGMLDRLKSSLPMSLWWLLPQYVLFGISDVFAMIGLQEFFYDQVPDGLRSLGLAMFLSIFGVGHFVSSFMIYVIDRVTGKGGAGSWFSNNLNRAHLDYFYWLLAGLCAIQLLAFVYFARRYIYKKKKVAGTAEEAAAALTVDVV